MPKIAQRALEGPHVAALNDASPGLGTALNILLGDYASVIEQLAGHAGTVKIEPATAQNVLGLTEPTIDHQGGRVAAGQAINDDELVTLEQVRKMLPGDTDTKIAAANRGKNKPACQEISLSHLEQIQSDMDAVFTVHPTAEFVIATGQIGGTGKVRVYRRATDNLLKLIGSTDAGVMVFSVLQGPYIFGVNDNGADNNLYIVYIGESGAPEPVASFSCGGATHGLDVRNDFAAVACNGLVRIVDVRTPGVPAGFGTL